MSKEWLQDKLIEAAAWVYLTIKIIRAGFFSIKPSVWFKCMIATGFLTAATIIYSFVIMPVWTYALVPAWAWISTPSPDKNPPAPIITSVNSNAPKSVSPAVSPPRLAADNPPEKQVNCDAIIRKIKAGKYTELPEECSSVYAISQEQDEKQLKERQEAQNQRDYERQQTDEQNRQISEQERQNELARQQQEAERFEQQRRQTAENARLAREQEEQARRDQQEKDRRDEARREQARQEAAERQRRQEDLQRQRNEAIIKAGRSIKEIFKKNN